MMSDTADQPGSQLLQPAVFSQLPGSCLIGISYFPHPDSGSEIPRGAVSLSPLSFFRSLSLFLVVVLTPMGLSTQRWPSLDNFSVATSDI